MRQSTVTEVLRRPPRLSRWDVVLLVVPATLWAVLGMKVEPEVLQPRCHLHPDTCYRESVNALDQVALDHESPLGQRLSDWLQNGSGTVAALVPLALGPVGAWATDLAILTEATCINGSVKSLVTLGVQRPRPGAYRSPHENGASPRQYTSFYSGHTSFVTVAMLSLWLSLFSRAKVARRGFLLRLTAVAGVLLVVATAFCRVWAGAHFPTDVLAAPWIPLIVCLGLAAFHRPANP
ncbi:MAG TPA: phosphatase PAP2 family protein [Bdellovibrionota bacterium]|nr:phosphatase PAP2 family protein [Bdellovibrionota bacterium]